MEPTGSQLSQQPPQERKIHNIFLNGSEKFAIDNNNHRKYLNEGPLKIVQYIEVKEKYLYD
jgi:hypothetical protein